MQKNMKTFVVIGCVVIGILTALLYTLRTTLMSQKKGLQAVYSVNYNGVIMEVPEVVITKDHIAAVITMRNEDGSQLPYGPIAEEWDADFKGATATSGGSSWYSMGYTSEMCFYIHVGFDITGKAPYVTHKVKNLMSTTLRDNYELYKKGRWEVVIPLIPTHPTSTKQINKEISINDTQVEVKEIQIDALSLKLKMESPITPNVLGHKGIETVEIRFKNGDIMELNLDVHPYKTQTSNNNVYELVYLLNQSPAYEYEPEPGKVIKLIEVEDIVSILIDNIDIY